MDALYAICTLTTVLWGPKIISWLWGMNQWERLSQKMARCGMSLLLVTVAPVLIQIPHSTMASYFVIGALICYSYFLCVIILTACWDLYVTRLGTPEQKHDPRMNVVEPACALVFSLIIAPICGINPFEMPFTLCLPLVVCFANYVERNPFGSFSSTI